MILGIDEVGRGPWAGPLVVGAVVLGGVSIEGLTDSKKISKKRRVELDATIRAKAAAYGLGWVSAKEIDEIGLSSALRLATIRAVEEIKVPYHEIIIDGTINFLAGTTKGEFVVTMAKADLLVPSVSAASIIAKVARDDYMAEQDKIYQDYAFSAHVGYGTAAHRAAIERNGVTPLHRLSFAPLRKYRPYYIGAVEKEAVSIPKNHMGAAAEIAAENYLVRIGHEIVERNWKTKYCEIDIVSLKDGKIYFTEVKYRQNATYGDGFSAITAKKYRQMKFAAEFYAQIKKLRESDMLLAAASLTGTEPTVEEWLVLRDEW